MPGSGLRPGILCFGWRTCPLDPSGLTRWRDACLNQEALCPPRSRIAMAFTPSWVLSGSLRATQSSPQGRHSGWEPFEVKIWTLFNNWSSVINHLKIFYKESHTQYFTKFLNFFVAVVFPTCLYKIEQPKKRAEKRKWPPSPPQTPWARGEGAARSGGRMSRIRPSWGLDNYLMGIVLSVFLFFKLKIYIYFSVYVWFFLFLYSPLSTWLHYSYTHAPARHGWHLGWVYSMGAHPGTSSGHGPYTHWESDKQHDIN